MLFWKLVLVRTVHEVAGLTQRARLRKIDELAHFVIFAVFLLHTKAAQMHSLTYPFYSSYCHLPARKSGGARPH